MTRKTRGIIGGIMIIGGLAFWMALSSGTPSPTQSGVPSKTPANPLISHKKTATGTQPASRQRPQHPSAPPSQNTLTLGQSFQATVHQPLPEGVTGTPVPWQRHASWAFVPHAEQGRLWFGQKSGHSWHWISEDLPGSLSRQLPTPVVDALQWADDLHANRPGPHLPGTISWSGIAGRVGEPVGWTAQWLSATHSPIGGQTLALTIWMPSETGVFHGVYGLETVWNAANAHTGQGALLMLVAAPHQPSERR